jgi:hypothetical protein
MKHVINVLNPSKEKAEGGFHAGRRKTGNSRPAISAMTAGITCRRESNEMHKLRQGTN